MRTMVNYEPAVDRMNAILMQKLAGFANTRGTLIQIPLFMQYYALDVIGEITLNKTFSFMAAESDVDDLIKTMHEGTVYQSTLGVMPEFHPLLHAVGPLLCFRNEGTELVDNATEKLNKHRKELKFGEEKSKTDPFITKLLKLEAAGKVNMGNVIDSIISNIAARSDTTAITISAALYHVYRNPKILAKLRGEIDTMAREGNVSDPVTFKEAQSMPYLQAVIQETLRIHPAVGYLLPRIVPKGGIEFTRRYFPESESLPPLLPPFSLTSTTQNGVGVCTWSLHRNKAVYGDDADVFRPERFLDIEKAADIATSFAFGGGTRTCIE